MNLFRRNRTEREEAVLDSVLASPIVDKILAEAEAEDLEQRRELLADLARINATRSSEPKRRAEACAAAVDRIEQAKAALLEAQHALVAARAHADAFAAADLNARTVIDRQLVETADPRLGEFAFQLMQIRDNALQERLGFWLEELPGDAWSSGGSWLRSNHEHLVNCHAALNAAMAQCHEMKRQVLSSAEVSQALGNLNVKLATVLAQVDLNPPSLTAAQHEVGPPLPWGSRVEWVTATVPVVEKPVHEPKWLRAPRRSRELRASLDAM